MDTSTNKWKVCVWTFELLEFEGLILTVNLLLLHLHV